MGAAALALACFVTLIGAIWFLDRRQRRQWLVSTFSHLRQRYSETKEVGVYNLEDTIADAERKLHWR